MKCEIKCIEKDFKEDCKTLGLKSGLLITLIAFIASSTLRIVLGELVYGYVSILIALAAIVYFAILGHFMWIDAVDYCRNRKIKAQNNIQGINHG